MSQSQVKQSKTQSVILNLNQNYANSKAHNYFQPVAQQIDIGENAEVCLYGASLQKKPIFISKDGEDNFFDFTIEPEVFPNIRQVEAGEAPLGILDIDKMPVNSLVQYQEIKFRLESGAYTIDDFGNRLVQEINTLTTEVLNGVPVLTNAGYALNYGGDDVVMQFPYSYTFENNNDDFYLGFQSYPYQQTDLKKLYTGKLNNSQYFPVDNNEVDATTGAGLELTYLEESNNVLDACHSITANATISTTDYQSFARIHDSAIFPLLRQQTELNNPIITAGQNESFFEFNIVCDETANNKTTDFVVGFTNTYLQSYWTNSDVPVVGTYYPAQTQIPECYLGVKIYEEISSGAVEHAHAEIFIPSKLTEWVDYIGGSNPNVIFEDGLQRVTKINLDERLEESGKFGFRFYAVDNQLNWYQEVQYTLDKNVDELSKYPRVYGFQFYCRHSGDPVKILYDSKIDGIFIPSPILEDGFCHNAVESHRVNGEYTNLGLQPYLFVNKLATGDGISSPRGNYIVQKDTYRGNQVYRYGMDWYEYITSSRDLKQVLGLPDPINQKIEIGSDILPYDFKFTENLNKRFDGNAYPDFKKRAGLVKLYPENTQYNIELNLPVKAYTTTEPNVLDKQNLGQKRTILYKTEPVIEGNLVGLDQAYITKNVVPNNLKFLTLNNSAPLNLNELNVQIRRSKTNELATELTDASIELLIKSE
jgi:hypothetical protein